MVYGCVNNFQWMEYKLAKNKLTSFTFNSQQQALFTFKMIRGQFQHALKAFLESPAHFQVVHSTTNVQSRRFERVLILDSSFNPPHRGHYSIIKKSLEHPEFASSVILLLLSVKNADKTVPKPAVFEDRLDMMYLMAEYISNKLNVEVHVGLTKHAKFVDKSTSIRNHFAGDKIFTFLLGFDTLIRIFDAKYYKPLTLKQSLDNFLTNNELFCLTRLDDKQFDVAAQMKFYEDIKSGLKEPEIPRRWSESIFMVNGDDDTLRTSSSIIRKQVEEGQLSWTTGVIEEIEEYIIVNKIYKL